MKFASVAIGFFDPTLEPEDFAERKVPDGFRVFQQLKEGLEGKLRASVRREERKARLYTQRLEKERRKLKGMAPFSKQGIKVLK